MSTLIVWTNNPSSLMASGIAPSDTTVTVTAGQGALFPALSAGQIAVGTFEDTSGNLEVVHFTARTTDTMTMVRAQEGTTALSFASGSRVELRVTAGVLATLLQKTGSDTLSGTTTFSGVLAAGSSGSFQGGEIAGSRIRGAPGETDNEFFVPTAGGAPTIGASVVLTAANIASNMPSGTGLALTNMIVFWAGASNAVPTGWHLCDGSNGTPDLRDVFIVGGGGSFPTSGGANTGVTGATSLGSLTIAAHALAAAELPTLVYQLWGTSAAANQASNWTLGNSSAQVGGYQVAGGSFVSVNGGGQLLVNSVGTGGAGGGVATGHSHTLGGSSSHAHTYDLPPYKAVFAIMKL